MSRLLSVGLLGLMLGLFAGPIRAQAPGPLAPANTAQDSCQLAGEQAGWLRQLRQRPATPEVAAELARLAAHPRLDTLRVVVLTDLSKAVMAHDVPAGRPAAVAALALSRCLCFRDFVPETLLDLADYHALLAHYDSATACLHEAAREFRRLHDLGGQVRCLGRLGRLAEQQGRYAASLDYLLQALALSDGGGDIRRFNTSFRIQLGTVYAQVGDYAEARRYLLSAQHLATHYDYPDRLNLALGGLGDVCRHQRQWQPARAYYQRSIEVSRRIGDEPYALAMQLNLARLHEDQGQLPAAAAEGRQVLARLQAASLPLLIPQAQALLARVALRQGQALAAIAYGRQSLAGSRQARLLTGVAEASAVLADAYARQRQYGPALAALRHYTAAHDSLLGADARRRTAVLQAGQQQREQQARIRLLTQQNHLQAERQQVARLRSQRAVFGLGALALLTLLLAGAGLFYFRRRQARREATLRTQLAADLHDDVGTLLSQISLQSELLQTGLADAAGHSRKLGQIAEASRNARRQLNDVVWSLDAHNDTLPNLLDRLRDYAYEVLSSAGLPVEFEVPEVLPAVHLSLPLRRQLYLLYKEALANVLRHAPTARWVRVALLPEGGGLRLEVSNELPPAAPGPARRSGHGLRNIAERATALGGQAICGPLPGEGGFGVRVWVPLA